MAAMYTPELSENSAMYQTKPLPLCQPAGNWTQTTANAYTATNNAATQDTEKREGSKPVL